MSLILLWLNRDIIMTDFKIKTVEINVEAHVLNFLVQILPTY